MTIRDTDYKPINDIPLRSPLALGGFFLHFLRVRFGLKDKTPWFWDPNDSYTELFIASGGVIENELRNNRPAIYVNVGQLRGSPIVTGNTADFKLNIDTKDSYGRVDANVTINCESSAKGESHDLGWWVFFSLMAAQDVIRTKYHIANMNIFDLVPPRPSKNDRETYVSTVNIGLNYELTWKVTAVQTFIKELQWQLDIAAQQDPTRFLTEIYLESVTDKGKNHAETNNG